MKILLVEDDPIIKEGLKLALDSEGCELKTASSVAEAKSILNEDYDICILDVMLPDGTGYDICAEIRKNSDTPIIFLTACDDELHTVLALEQGADDYIAKPFRMRELMARIKAVLRRTGGRTENAAETVKVGSNDVNIRTGKVFRNGAEVVLTAMEYKLLLIFINNRGSVISRQQILHNIWDVAGDFVTDNTLTVYVKRLREKLGDDEEVIKTVRGLGYRMD
ncbi:MAG: response regulator transcription factor [Oscillospiraceae bacterium]|nr:response regulator transcription factor [Oscillospiraceae bacterium]MBR3534334.1 response regulator transcription factor [Oscillospiraceae bacterium]